jgi:SAM-dependent methyltransferase
MPLACPLCASVLELGPSIVCAHGHVVGRVVDGVLDFRRAREGVDAELAAFWDSSDDYYECARLANDDYSDAHHEPHRATLAAFEAIAPRRVLDVGCGSGEFAAALVERLSSVEYVGVDVSLRAVAEARALGRPGMFLAADAEQLPFADASFQGVLSLFALEHFAHPRQVLAELVRVLSPGGVLALVSVAYDRPWGTIPSVRLGLTWRGRKLPRLNPANLAVYSVNRLRFGARQALKQIRFALDRSYRSFELVARPLVLEGSYDADLDAVHVVSPRSVVRELRQLGLTIDESTVNNGVGAFVMPFRFSVIARKPM